MTHPISRPISPPISPPHSNPDSNPNSSSSSAHPTLPTVVTAERLGGGNIRLRWTGPVGDGTRYQVWRQIDETGPFAQLGCEVDGGIGGGAGLEANTFTDTSVGPDAKSVRYYVVTELADSSTGGGQTISSKSDVVNVRAAEAA